MNILFTGGTGLIGSAFIQRFAKQHTFTVLTRQPNKAVRILGSKVTTISRLDTLKNLDKFDAVINLAGEPIADKRWSASRKARLEQSRWNITSEVATLINRSSNPPAVFISGSAVGYYGRQGALPITENENSFTIHSEYSHELCRVWEETARISEHNTRLCIVRTGIVLAPKGGALARMVPPFTLGLGGPIGSGEQMMSWIHLDDMVNLLAYLLEHEQCRGNYNATAPNPVNNHEFSRTIAHVLRRPCMFKVPAFALRAVFGDMADLILTGQAALPARLQKEGFKFQYPTLEPALINVLKNDHKKS